MSNQNRNNDSGSYDQGVSPCHDCCASIPNPSLCQNLTELDFEKGIWQAALDDNVHKIVHLINNQNVHPDALDSYGYTALHYAARNGRILAAKCLLKHGANVNFRTKNNGATPLMRAVTANKIEMVKFLLKESADPLMKDFDSLNAIERAMREDHREIVKLLLKQ